MNRLSNCVNIYNLYIMKELIIMSMLYVAVGTMAQTTTAVINPIEPVQYKNENGKFQILSYIQEDCLSQTSLKCYVNDQSVDLVKTERSDSVLVTNDWRRRTVEGCRW